jgi:hypothetical protein
MMKNTMAMKLHHRKPTYLMAGGLALAAACVWPVLAQTASSRRAPPPKFDPAEVEKTFFLDAREALVGTRPTENTASRTMENQVPPSKDGAQPVPSGRFRWSQWISAETLADEIKSYPALLARVTSTPSQFKGKGARDARRYFSVLAAMFAMIADHDQDVRWKNQAAAARELFARAGFNSKSDNDNAYNEAKLRTADLTLLLRGERIEPPANVEPKPNFNEQIANRPPLMWRLELAQQERLTPWTANATEFKKNAPAIGHEAEIVAALAQVIMHPSYPDADSESYLGYAKALALAAGEVRDAVQQKNADAARASVARLSKACNDCHGDFRGG